MAKTMKHTVFNLTKTGISIPNSVLKEHLGIQPGDMVFAVMANGRILLKRFAPNDLTDATDKAILGVPMPSDILQIEATSQIEDVQEVTQISETTGSASNV